MSDAVREQLRITPKATPSEIKQALAAKDIHPSDSLISAVKYGKKGKRKKKPGRKKGRPAAAPVVAAKRKKRTKRAKSAKVMIAIDDLATVNSLIKTLGGHDNAVKVISALKSANA